MCLSRVPPRQSFGNFKRWSALERELLSLRELLGELLSGVPEGHEEGSGDGHTLWGPRWGIY